VSVEAAAVTDPLVRVERDGTRARVTMNRPDVRNAFNAELITALRDAFEALSTDDGVRSIVLAGEGKSFSGGADIAWMRAALDLSAAENLRDAEAFAAMLIAIDRCPKPVVARVHGAALGGGCGLAAVADIVVAADDTVFGFTEVKLGIVPAVISPFVIPKIGVSHARALFVTGETFGAVHAQRIGLVHHVVPAAELDARVALILDHIRTAAPSAIGASKALVRNVSAATPDEATALTTREIARQRTTPEGQEGLRAFLERRPATWHDR
jgi:methylglutaconyl-CoA hydratase